MNKVYFDNSSTSLPKAPGVSSAMKNFLDNEGFNVGRGGYSGSLNVAMDILHTRELLAAMFGAARSRDIVFTAGLTHSINMLLSGFLAEGDHVITTSMEHNSVMRPLHALSKQRDASYSVAECDKNGVLNPDDITALIQPHTKAVIMTHASNVCGTIMPVAKVGQICKQHGVRLIVDAAQTAGMLPIDMQAAHIDALTFPGHKALLGPQGIGGFAISEDFAQQVDPIIWGGTGSKTQELDQPDFLPDKFESGTMNIPGIVGLKVAIEYITDIGIDAIYQRKMELYQHFVDASSEIPEMRLIAVDAASANENNTQQPAKVAIASVDFPQFDNASITAKLDKQFNIMARCGMHCAPAAHKTLGTYPQGTLRFSFGYQNSIEEVDFLLSSIKQVMKDAGNGRTIHAAM